MGIKFTQLAQRSVKIKTINHYFCGHKLIQLASGMQSNQFKSDSTNLNLTLNPANMGTQTLPTDSVATILSLTDPSFDDSLSINYIAPDSVIIYGGRVEWSQFQKAYVPKFNYKKALVS